jgi:acyl-CoA thioester hydrolase
MSKTEIIVRYAETDQMGIVHHSVYAIWFEAGRTDYLEQEGYPYSKMEAEGLMLPLSKLDCKFLEGAKYGDTVIVDSRVEKISPFRVEIAYSVFRKKDNTLLAEGKTVHAWTDRSLKIVNLKTSNPPLFHLFQSLIGTDKPEKE